MIAFAGNNKKLLVFYRMFNMFGFGFYLGKRASILKQQAEELRRSQHRAYFLLK
jgi:hypothetical protein